jgi:hypothetical protein
MPELDPKITKDAVKEAAILKNEVIIHAKYRVELSDKDQTVDQVFTPNN